MLEFPMFCPRHHTEMVEATHWVKQDGKPFPRPIHACGQDGCLYVYDVVNGYREVAETEPVGNAMSQVLSRRR